MFQMTSGITFAWSLHLEIKFHIIYLFEITINFKGKESLMFHSWKPGNPDKIWNVLVAN